MDFPGPSTYTPLMRRLFGNERQREIDEARQLYLRMRAERDALSETVELVTTMVRDELDPLPDDLGQALDSAIRQVLAAETHIFELPVPDFERMSMQEFVDFNNFLRAKEYFFANKYPVFQTLYDALTRLFCGLAKELPKTQLPSPSQSPSFMRSPVPGSPSTRSTEPLPTTGTSSAASSASYFTSSIATSAKPRAAFRMRRAKSRGSMPTRRSSCSMR